MFLSILVHYVSFMFELLTLFAGKFDFEEKILNVPPPVIKTILPHMLGIVWTPFDDASFFLLRATERVLKRASQPDNPPPKKY